jgi:hypothetical protein
MNLVSLKVAGIRGFNDEQTLDFHGKIVIYSGRNACGKTSIGEAIEWLLYGKTLKRTKGDEISKREYAGSYQNAHFSGPSLPFVEIKIVDPAGRSHTIRRQLDIDESSTLTVDGSPASDLGQFGVGAFYDRPLILQHTLQDFIFMKPKTRYEVLSAMLGLEPLIEFRNSVEAAKTEFSNNLPSVAITARHRAGILSASFREHPLLQPVALAIGNGRLKEARKQLVEVALGRVPSGTEEVDLLQALMRAKASKERARLDWGRFSLNPIPVPERNPAISDVDRLVNIVEEFERRVSEAAFRAAASSSEEVSPLLKSFYENGLQLVDPTRPEGCPFCLQESLTPSRLAELRNVVAPVPEARARFAQVGVPLDALRAALERQWYQMMKLIPVLPSHEERGTLDGLVDDLMVAKGSYLASCDAIGEASEHLNRLKVRLDETLAATEDAVKQGNVPSASTPALRDVLVNYGDSVRNLPGVTNGYAATYSALDPYVKANLASDEDVKLLSTLIGGIEHWRSVEISRQVDQILDELQELIRQARQFIETKQKQILGVRDKQIKSWYSLLTGSAQVGYEGLTPGTDNLELRATTFAKGMMAAPNLSGSQLNCIGISVYLATCTRRESPFQFVLFDDPIQSMDDDHTQAFKKQVIDKLLKQGLQVILLTHMDNFADDVGRLYRGDDPLIYRMDNYTQSGPGCVWKGPEIKKLLNDVRKNKDAINEGFRKQAVQALRQFVERIVKDIFTTDSGEEVSKKYESVAWPELRNLLRLCPSFDPPDEAHLEDTYNFTSPFLHTDEVLPEKVPSPHQINPHYVQMKSILEKYSPLLKLG